MGLPFAVRSSNHRGALRRTGYLRWIAAKPPVLGRRGPMVCGDANANALVASDTLRDAMGIAGAQGEPTTMSLRDAPGGLFYVQHSGQTLFI